MSTAYWIKLLWRLEISSKITLKQLFQSPLTFLAFGFGAGLLVIAPGTWGTLVAIPIIVGFTYLPEWMYLATIVFFFIAGIWICEAGETALQIHDHPGVVWDEIVGMMLVMAFIPVTSTTLILGFIFFRFFDILKPWPIRYVDRQVQGGFGTMLDDMLAAVIANTILRIVLLYPPHAMFDL